MQFVTTPTPNTAATYMHDLITRQLVSGKHVLWLLSGGSAIALEARIHKLLSSVLTDKLVIMQIDERYGPVGHANSNWQQLLDAGLEIKPEEIAIPVLNGTGQNETTEHYNNLLSQEIAKADYICGLFGMGADGHTSGILPGSSAITATTLVHSYTGPDYIRITTTPLLIPFLDEAILCAFGEAKLPMLQKLQTKAPIDEQPAQILKQAKKFVIFTNQDL